MYFDTVASETVRPSFKSSPWILGAPHRGLARLIRGTRSRTSLLGHGPTRPTSALPRPIASEADAAQTTHRKLVLLM